MVQMTQKKEHKNDTKNSGRADNCSLHSLFKFTTKETVSVNCITIIPITEDIDNRVTQMGKNDDEPENIQIVSIVGNLIIVNVIIIP